MKLLQAHDDPIQTHYRLLGPKRAASAPAPYAFGDPQPAAWGAQRAADSAPEASGPSAVGFQAGSSGRADRSAVQQEPPR